MTRGCSRVMLVERPINEPIEEHRCCAREDHARDHQKGNSQCWPAIRRNNQRAESKWQREDRVRKTNEPQKTSDMSVSKVFHRRRKELLVLGSAGCQPVVRSEERRVGKE